MKIDHLVINVDASVQEDKHFIQLVHEMGLPYKPKWGKGTKGFKVSNLWIGKEYFELVRIKAANGGGWVKSWTDQYLNGHRGLVGFALEVDNIEAVYQKLLQRNIEVSPPEHLKFRWFFNLLQKTMPWRNSYLPQFRGVPFQFFLQQLDDEKSRQFMEQYMVPNSTENNIEAITEVIIYGQLTDDDKKIIYALFDHYEEDEQMLEIHLGKQKIRFVQADTNKTEVHLTCLNESFRNKKLAMHNVHICNS